LPNQEGRPNDARHDATMRARCRNFMAASSHILSCAPCETPCDERVTAAHAASAQPVACITSVPIVRRWGDELTSWRRSSAMPFVVKWLPQDTAAVVTDSHLFDHLRDALNHACATVKQRPTDIWVEDETGKRIAYQQRIIEHCTIALSTNRDD
jgi:hypothetical protein